ncbi:iron uptake transporter deferrochelatase/peroxidase subunit [Humibacter ginsenosidimutans]|uniref:Deferrochelatase n=1 Tax=Humibacter ginsenosidimutans TaxID=2599293 RepID=A0A5B8M126_9MICO|nr:iron uptake transporter deferrochelatase/peroxidase subunit [Humibacter ginsenosidimutans]QDZ14377.1 deferrochelatase/peroxidase EfeB [Humibacter ginsenosidimutans]
MTDSHERQGDLDDVDHGVEDAVGATQGSAADPQQHASTHVSRRGLFAMGAGGLAVGALAGFGGTVAAQAMMPQDDGEAVDASVSHPFYGNVHQAGVQTEPQRHCVYMTFDVDPGTTATDLQSLFAMWSAGIAQLMQGKPVGLVQPPRAAAVPADTGEATDLSPNALTVTLGLGPGIFDDRFGLAHKRPTLLKKLPALPSDNLQAALSGGDLSLQACAEDPQVAYHAIRDLARIGRGTVSTRWTVMGFGRASAGANQMTPRNLMGFKDGTRNVRSDDEFRQFVWLDDADWMSGGTYQVARKIQMNIEIWDASGIGSQQDVFGRTKSEGAPLGEKKEFDTPDFAATEHGQHVIPQNAHIALAAHENNGGVKILRRSYNYTDGINQFGQLDAGLMFIAYMNDPQHFVKLQTRLGSYDQLNEYISHIGSAIFAVPPAPEAGHYLAEKLFS